MTALSSRARRVGARGCRELAQKWSTESFGKKYTNPFRSAKYRSMSVSPMWTYCSALNSALTRWRFCFNTVNATTMPSSLHMLCWWLIGRSEQLPTM